MKWGTAKVSQSWRANLVRSLVSGREFTNECSYILIVLALALVTGWSLGAYSISNRHNL